MFKSSVANVAVFVVPLLAFCLWFIPKYGVWQAELSGKSAQMRAEQENQIRIEQAKAELESAKIRAEAIAIIEDASQQSQEYRSQESTGKLSDADKSIAASQRVPTGAGNPIVKSETSSQKKGPSGFVVDLLKFSAKENRRARQRTLPTDSRTIVTMDRVRCAA